MKKLAMLAIVAMAAVVSNAMCVDWKYTGTSAQNGQTVYLILGDTPTTTWASIDAVKAAAKDSGKLSKSGTTYFTSGSISDSSITKSAADYYFVIVPADEKSYQVSVAVDASSKVYDPEAQETTPGNFNLANKNAGWSASKDFPGGAPVPEPTSGLLVLLGVAGLALRRRRA